MNSRKIYADMQFVNPIINGLTPTNITGLSNDYEIDNSIWTVYMTDSMYIGKGIPVLYKKPKPTTEELVTLTMESPFNDEAYGACFILRDTEMNEGIEFRHLLIDKLETINLKKQGIEQKERIKNIILFTELENPVNQREVIGKNLDHIEKDSAFFSEISGRAIDLMDKIKPTFFERIRMKISGK